MRLTKYKEVNPGVFERKVLWLESRIFCRNSYLRVWLRRKLNTLLIHQLHQ